VRRRLEIPFYRATVADRKLVENFLRRKSGFDAALDYGGMIQETSP
jgi:hypothetical protein